jgi:hypothetical protein
MKYALILILLMITTPVLALRVTEPKMSFTGYKFLQKEAVSGTFKDITWNIAAGKTLKEILLKTRVEIDSYSIDAGNPARNSNIKNGLFQNWGSQKIEITVKKYLDSLNVVQTELKVGKIKRKIFFQINQQNDELIMTASIDLVAMGFQKAFQELAKLCSAFHKDALGTSKTWSVVDLEVRAKIIP